MTEIKNLTIDDIDLYQNDEKGTKQTQTYSVKNGF